MAVERSVHVETRCRVNLDQPSFEVLVKHDIEPQDLEADLPESVTTLGCFVDVTQFRLDRDNSLVDQISDSIPDHLPLHTEFLLNSIEDALKRSFRRVARVFFISLLVILGLLINCVVREMHLQFTTFSA